MSGRSGDLSIASSDFEVVTEEERVILCLRGGGGVHVIRPKINNIGVQPLMLHVFFAKQNKQCQ